MPSREKQFANGGKLRIVTGDITTIAPAVHRSRAIAIEAISNRLESAEISVREVIVVLFDAGAYQAFERLLLE